MARDGILCPRCIKDWVQPSGEAVKGVQWFVCPSCDRWVAFTCDATAPDIASTVAGAVAP